MWPHQFVALEIFCFEYFKWIYWFKMPSVPKMAHFFAFAEPTLRCASHCPYATWSWFFVCICLVLLIFEYWYNFCIFCMHHLPYCKMSPPWVLNLITWYNVCPIFNVLKMGFKIDSKEEMLLFKIQSTYASGQYSRDKRPRLPCWNFCLKWSLLPKQNLTKLSRPYLEQRVLSHESFVELNLNSLHRTNQPK